MSDESTRGVDECPRNIVGESECMQMSEEYDESVRGIRWILSKCLRMCWRNTMKVHPTKIGYFALKCEFSDFTQ